MVEIIELLQKLVVDTGDLTKQMIDKVDQASLKQDYLIKYLQVVLSKTSELLTMNGVDVHSFVDPNRQKSPASSSKASHIKVDFAY